MSLQNGRQGGGVQSEDCLYLNIWASRENRSTPKPVMVWIHGGGFTQGSGSQRGYDGTALARKDVVLVTLNYRLGALGFLPHPALTAESEHDSSGNYGILDQIAALQWVQDNIGQFGGDADNVTIFGESAGGTSVYLLTATPLAKGLFQKAILESPWLDPSIFRNLVSENENGPAAQNAGEEALAAVLASDVNSNADTSAVAAALRALPAETVLNKLNQRWPIVTDGWIFPKDPRRIFADGEQHDVPIVIGTNRDEGTMFALRNPFASVEQYRAAMEKRFGDASKRVVAYYDPKTTDEIRDVLVQQITDGWFVQPARQLARAMVRQGTDAWMYHFTKPVWAGLGAAHAAEIGYVFGNLNNPSAEDSELSATMMAYWVNFASTGNPNGNDLLIWPAYTEKTDQHLVLDESIDVADGLRREANDMLDEILSIDELSTDAMSEPDNK
jgi:para-nitrobenzyl esterase